MKALSIRQPWIWAMLHAGKDVENRSWPTEYRGPIYLHASKVLDIDGKEWIRNQMGIKVPGDLPRGGVVARALLVNCVKIYSSPWFFGEFGFVLREIEPVPFIPCKGALGIFEIPEQMVIG